jgi:hypothetical protein
MCERNAAVMKKRVMPHRKPVTKRKTAKRNRKPIDFVALRALTDSMPLQKESAGASVRRMRDQDRY